MGGNRTRRRPKHLKVWGGITFPTGYHRGARTVIAAHNQREAADKVGTSLHHFRGYWSETGNIHEVNAAMNYPGSAVIMGEA